MSGDGISGRTQWLGVLGWPVRFSLSPKLHNFWLREAGIDAVYLPLPVAESDFAQAVRALPRLGCIGANVTMPHKEALVQLVDRLDPVAAKIGAVNTLVQQPDGGWFGTNTDAYGFAENVRQAGHDPAASPALVLGAGGAARAVLAALQRAGCKEIYLTNRSPERAQALAQAFGGKIQLLAWQDWPQQLAQIRLLINTTSCGMHGENDFTVPLDALPRDAAVCDLLYHPPVTGLLRAAQAADRLAINGLGMLLYQAQASFQHWFGQKPAVDEQLRRFVLGQDA